MINLDSSSIMCACMDALEVVFAVSTKKFGNKIAQVYGMDASQVYMKIVKFLPSETGGERANRHSPAWMAIRAGHSFRQGLRLGYLGTRRAGTPRSISNAVRQVGETTIPNRTFSLTFPLSAKVNASGTCVYLFKPQRNFFAPHPCAIARDLIH